MTRSVQITITGPSIHESVVFKAFPVRIGRDADCECRLGYPLVSRHHARLDLRGDDLLLTDEGSTYGTHVRGMSQRLREPVVLADVGNEFQIGALTFHVALDATKPESPPPTAETGSKAITVTPDQAPVVPSPTRSYADGAVDPEKMDAEVALASLHRDLAEQRTRTRERVLGGLAAMEQSKRAATFHELVRTFPELLQVPELAELASASGVVRVHPDAALAAHAALETFRARYVEGEPALDSPQKIEAFVGRLDAGWRCVLQGVASLLFAYDGERNRVTSRPMPERLASMLLEDEAQRGLLARAFERMAANHSQLIGESIGGVRRLLDELSPEGFEPIGFAPFRGRARWRAYVERFRELSSLDASTVGRLFGPTFARMFADLGA